MSVPLVEITGIDGAGKSTVAAALAARFGWEPRKVQPFSPEVMAQVEASRASLGERGADVARSLALSGALLRHAELPHVPTVYDRYIESARMWWAVKSQPPIPQDVIAQMRAPTLVILLEVDPAVGMARRLGSTEVSRESECHFINACSAYLRQEADANGWVVLDAAKALDVVIAEASHAVDASLSVAS